MNSRTVELAHPWNGHAVGERLTVDEPQARSLVQSAVARYWEDPAMYPCDDVFPHDETLPGDPSESES